MCDVLYIAVFHFYYYYPSIMCAVDLFFILTKKAFCSTVKILVLYFCLCLYIIYTVH